MSSLFADSVAPINDSIQGSFESTITPFLTIPMVVLLGVLIVLFILFVKFRDQIVLASELMMRKIQMWWRGVMETPPPMPTQVDAVQVDGAAINRMLPSHGKEVFHVGENKYTYAEAAPLCESIGAELATYEDVKKAMDAGADWCEAGYGWVKGQMAVYPTQESTFQKLQQGPEDQRNACGTRPGLQGGAFDNPDLKFGATCIGKKPAQSDRDRRVRGKALTPDALTYQKEVNRFKQQSNEIPVSPFNSNTWNS